MFYFRSSCKLAIRHWHRCFPVNFVKFLRTPENISGRLLVFNQTTRTTFIARTPTKLRTGRILKKNTSSFASLQHLKRLFGLLTVFAKSFKIPNFGVKTFLRFFKLLKSPVISVLSSQLPSANFVCFSARSMNTFLPSNVTQKTFVENQIANKISEIYPV